MNNDTINNEVIDTKKEMKVCNEKCECWSRVTGFFRPVENFNVGKKQEFKERNFYKL